MNIKWSFLLALCIVAIACSSTKKIVGNNSIPAEYSAIYDRVQRSTFQYFWDGAEPTSGLARERFHVDGVYPENDKHIITSGGGGFGVMAIVTAIHRGFITREEGRARLQKIVDFLESADKFKGAFPHWLNGATGKVQPFSAKDDGADLVETSFLMQGLLTARQYFDGAAAAETTLRNDINALWRAVEWDWFTKGGENVLYWHWSPGYGWERTRGGPSSARRG